MKIKTAAESLITTVSVGVALVLLNALTCQARAKVDLTEQKVYTLAAASRRLVHDLPEKVHARAYFANVPQEHVDKQRYIEDLLTEYAEASGGKFTWEKIEPSDKPEKQAELKREGVSPTPIPAVKDDKFELVLSYFTVQFTYLDKKETWAPDQNFFRSRSMEGLEYDYSTLIRRLTTPKRKVGVTSGYGEPRQRQIIEDPRVGLSDMYDVVEVNWAQKPKDIENVDVLVVNGPTQKVSDQAKYYLDQHLMKGKPVLFLLRGVAWTAGGNQQMPNFVQQDQPYLGQPVDHDLGPLLAHYGFQVGSDSLLDAINAAPGMLPLGTPPLLMQRFPFFPLTEVLAKDKRDPLEGMDYVAMPFASSVTLTGRLQGGKLEGGQVRPLFRTSPASFARSGLQVITRGMKIEAPKDARGPYVVGYLAQGPFPSFFAGKPLPAGVDAPASTPEAGAAADGGLPMSTPAAGEPVAESPAATRLIVVGANEFVSDSLVQSVRAFGPQPFLNGFQALHNMVDWLAQDTDLISIRSKVVQRPLRGLDKSDRLLVKYGNMLGAPLALVLLGVVSWRVRVRRRRHVKL